MYSPTQRASASTGSSSSQNPRSVDAALLAGLIQRVHDPVVARIFLSTVEAHPELQLQFLGAFLRAQETVKRSQMRYAKARDAGQAAAAAKARAISVLRTVALESFALARGLVNLWQLRRARAAIRASVHPQTAKVIALPLDRKATGTGR